MGDSVSQGNGKWEGEEKTLVWKVWEGSGAATGNPGFSRGEEISKIFHGKI